MSILGTRVLRKEDPKFLTSGAGYVADLFLVGSLYATYVRSAVAHGRVLSIDLEEAQAAPGVVAVLTAADIDLAPRPPAFAGMVNAAMTREWLARDVVRFVGEPLAVIITERADQGEDAADLVVVDYEPLPVLISPEDAMTGGEVVLFPEAGTNVALEMRIPADDDLFAGCDVVVRQRIVNQRLAPCPLEVRSCAAEWGVDGRVTVWLSSQAPHTARDSMAEALGLDQDQIHLITPDVGGGFGAKGGTYVEEMLVPWLAQRFERPVRWTETRSESMVGLGHGRGQVQQAELGGRRDGTLLAYRLDVVQDAGAYPSVGTLLPFLTRSMMSGVYEIPAQEFQASSVVTNTTPTVPYRGAGRPEATAAIERMVDLFAAEIGMDPVDVRRRNLIAADAFPYQTKSGSTYDSGDYEMALDRVLEAAGYAELRAEQARRRADGGPRQLGIGVSTYVEVTGGAGGKEYGAIEILPNGRAVVRTGTSPHGQGHVTAWAMLASEQTGIPVEHIDVIHSDTDLVPRGEGTMGSRSLQQGGVAVHQAAVAVVERARVLAAEQLEANPDDIVLDKEAGRLHVAGTPTAGRSWAELAQTPGGLSAEADMIAEGTTFPFGAHIVVAEVDVDTGHTTIERVVAVDDAGTILNPMLLQGQVHGGLAQGVAQALMEEVRYDEDGNPLTSNFADYSFISAVELPTFELINPETPTPLNELGAKGIGESGTIGSTPAVQNAVIDAVSHLGVRHIDMPTTPERVWRAIEAAGAGAAPDIETSGTP